MKEITNKALIKKAKEIVKLKRYQRTLGLARLAVH